MVTTFTAVPFAIGQALAILAPRLAQVYTQERCMAWGAAMVPVAGSAYTYAYATLGELFAWIIGWDLVLEYGVASAAVAWMVSQRSRVLAELHLTAVEPVLLSARKSELQSFVNLGRSAIRHLVRDGMPDAAAQKQALAILKQLEFSHDGTFFVFDFEAQIQQQCFR
jgi:hypothetical protein